MGFGGLRRFPAFSKAAAPGGMRGQGRERQECRQPFPHPHPAPGGKSREKEKFSPKTPLKSRGRGLRMNPANIPGAWMGGSSSGSPGSAAGAGKLRQGEKEPFEPHPCGVGTSTPHARRASWRDPGGTRLQPHNTREGSVGPARAALEGGILQGSHPEPYRDPILHQIQSVGSSRDPILHQNVESSRDHILNHSGIPSCTRSRE